MNAALKTFSGMFLESKVDQVTLDESEGSDGDLAGMKPGEDESATMEEAATELVSSAIAADKSGNGEALQGK